MSLSIISGPMLAGKTNELIRRVHRVRYAGQDVSVFHSALDDRYGEDSVASHCGVAVESIGVDEAADIAHWSDELNPDVVAIDEAQFLDKYIVHTVELLSEDCWVIVAGLNLDYRGEPFGYMADLMVRADDVTTLTAICTSCGDEATRTQRLIKDQDTVVVGGQESYTARCRACHDPRLANVPE